MEILLSIINTALLIAILWYQKNKNKVLSDRISEQSLMLKETKDIISQQSMAIDSQKSVVDTALEYSKHFDIEKVESLIKREVELEHRQSLKEIEDKYEDEISSLQNLGKMTISEFKKGLRYVIELVTDKNVEQVTRSHIVPLLEVVFSLLYSKSYKDRESYISEVPEDMVEPLRRLLAKADKSKPKGLRSFVNSIK